MKANDIHYVVKILRNKTKVWKVPFVTRLKNKNLPFWVLISCLLSLRTRDEVTEEATYRLMELAESPHKMGSLDPERLEKTIYPVAFYKVKGQRILQICQDLKSRYSGRVPDSIEELLTLKGVGRKTASLTVTLGYGKPGICVDTHVHRITNRWGYVKTKNSDETEMSLRKKLPERYWIQFNELLVAFGQNCCKPISPFCSQCRLDSICQRVGVKRSR